MQHAALLRLLELVERKLGASDARVEIGGQPPTAPELIWVELPRGMRLVVVFDDAPDDTAALHTRLADIAATFTETLNESHDEDERAQTPSNLPRRRLDDALQALCTHMHADNVVIVDVQSPVLWGTAVRGDDNDVDELEELGRALARAQQRGIAMRQLLDIPQDELSQRLSHAGLLAAQVWSLERALQAARARARPLPPLMLARAIFEVRAAHRAHPGERTVTHSGDVGLLARPFANIYRLIAIFDGDFSELHVESSMLQAVPTMEQLLFALPPVDPPPKAGKVMRLPNRNG